MTTSNLDDIASKLPQIEFRKKKKIGNHYNQKMQSLRGGRKFYLTTSPNHNGTVRLSLFEYGDRTGEVLFVASRNAIYNNADTFQSALKSLERKARCKLYYVLLISTDGEYL